MTAVAGAAAVSWGAVTAFMLVGIGGIAGAVVRYLVGTALSTTVATTLAVNVAGSLALGALVASSLGEPLVLALGTGFCGAFTTFSSFAVDAVTTWGSGDRRLAVGYALGTLAGAAAALGAAWALATLLGF